MHTAPSRNKRTMPYQAVARRYIPFRSETHVTRSTATLTRTAIPATAAATRTRSSTPVHFLTPAPASRICVVSRRSSSSLHGPRPRVACPSPTSTPAISNTSPTSWIFSLHLPCETHQIQVSVSVDRRSRLPAVSIAINIPLTCNSTQHSAFGEGSQ